MTRLTPRLIGCLILACIAFGAAPRAGAERILFQRGTDLFVAGEDGRDSRKLFTIGDPMKVAWAPSPDGRRIAWYAFQNPSAASALPVNSLQSRPISLWLSDLSGQRRKVLFTTNNLRDRQGQTVTETWTGKAVPLADWSPISVAWSPGGKTLYLSCARLAEEREHATFVVDAITGTAVVDSKGRWKSIAPAVEVDTRYPYIVGVGAATTTVSSTGDEPFFPLVVTDMPQSKTVALLGSPVDDGMRIPYRLAAAPALSPDAKTIAFTAIGDGLWQVDVHGRSYRRITDRRDDEAPRWSEDGGRLFFLSSSGSGGQFSDLFTIAAPFTQGPRRLVIRSVDRFFLIPD